MLYVISYVFLCKENEALKSYSKQCICNVLTQDLFLWQTGFISSE